MTISDRSYTVITFAPVQGFIEKSRKLRDLYGSSFILSYLADTLCKEAEARGFCVVSPALIDVTQGTPNQIIIKGNFAEKDVEQVLNKTWKKVVDVCRTWVERNIKQENGQHFDYLWQRNWDLWKNHAWEFFWETGNSITEARENLNEKKRSRNWIGINWTGESSTLSGADGIAWYGMGIGSPKERSMAAEDEAIKKFYQQLSNKIGEATISGREQLSIPELIKRLITIEEFVEDLGIKTDELPKSFKELNRHQEEFEEELEIVRNEKNETRYSGWFQGDGDKAGDFLKKLAGTPEEEKIINSFSSALRNWGEKLDKKLPKSPRYLITKSGEKQATNRLGDDGRIVYAGGDDLLGVLYRNFPNPILTGYDCIKWFYQFESDEKNTIWKEHKQPISISIGFVWAAPKVPQRDVLQHCREAEKSAKINGRDRLAIRILFNSGNHLEWVCPWWFLNILDDYRDRNHQTGDKANWSHIYEDVALLESRHAFTKQIDKNHRDLETSEELQKHIQVALSVLEIYFPNQYKIVKNSDYWLEHYRDDGSSKTGILGASEKEILDSFKSDRDSKLDTQRKLNKWKIERFNNWAIDLAKVGFHLCRKQNQSNAKL